MEQPAWVFSAKGHQNTTDAIKILFCIVCDTHFFFSYPYNGANDVVAAGWYGSSLHTLGPASAYDTGIRGENTARPSCDTVA